MNYPNLPNSVLEITEQPEVKEITNELLKQLQNALHSNALFTDQIKLSLKGIVRILEVLLSLDFFKNANEIDSSLRNSIEWLSNAGESLKLKMKEYEGFFSEFNASMHANEQEVTSILNANTENIKSEIKKLENQEYEGFFSEFNASMHANEQEVTSILNANTENIKSEIKKLENQLIETTTRLLTSYQIFLNNARDNANNQITENKTESLEAITNAKTTANNEINTNKTESLEAITNAKRRSLSKH
ncbi:DUF1542 domain-containing protein [Helicobacter pylori]|uniref:DUF1542 domain-containing protein n=1 Tax=Helicobacter pylori TaxID=210 RepID=UPI000BEA9F6B|nr:DUF1542 domain-containing protein [Helicobacter pylori]PDW20015.1 DUF1542 domain-containing protein [Helicobacter pylori]